MESIINATTSFSQISITWDYKVRRKIAIFLRENYQAKWITFKKLRVAIERKHESLQRFRDSSYSGWLCDSTLFIHFVAQNLTEWARVVRSWQSRFDTNHFVFVEFSCLSSELQTDFKISIQWYRSFASFKSCWRAIVLNLFLLKSCLTKNRF